MRVGYWKGKKLSEETKIKMSLAKKGKIPQNIELFLVARKNYKVTDEDRKNRSEMCKLKGIRPPSRKGLIPWNRGKTNIYSKETLKKISQNTSKAMIGHLTSEETRKKIGVAHSKEKSTFWKGGISQFNRTERQILTDTFEYRQWRRIIFGRDDYICQICGEKGGRIHANHIKKWLDYPELRLVVRNGITVCEQCDIKLVNHHELEWESYFNFNLITREMVYLADL